MNNLYSLDCDRLPPANTAEGQVLDVVLQLITAIDQAVKAGLSPEIAINALLGACIQCAAIYRAEPAKVKAMLLSTAGEVEGLMASIQDGSH